MRRLSEIIGKMMFEIIAVVIGISIAFFVDEAKDKSRDRETKRNILTAISSELASDSATLNQRLLDIDLFLNSYRRLLRDSLHKDSLFIYTDRLISYSAYKPTNLYYTEMKQAGTSRLFADRKLLNQVIDLNENEARLIDESVSIDKNFILNRMIPYMEKSAGFPYIAGLKDALRKSNEFRNLVLSNILFKEIDKHAMLNYQVKARNLYRELNNALEELD